MNKQLFKKKDRKTKYEVFKITRQLYSRHHQKNFEQEQREESLLLQTDSEKERKFKCGNVGKNT